MSLTIRQLCWSQRVALVRHNLHTACRTGDFTFFRALQAAGMVDGVNHIATFAAAMGDEADATLAALDNLNTGLAYVHQDAFKTLYDNLKEHVQNKSGSKSQVHVNMVMQKAKADASIDKMTSSAVALINQQPEHVRDTAANVWITGTLIVADAIDITLKEMNALETNMDDFILLEESWANVKSATVAANVGLKGVFSFLAESDNQSDRSSVPSMSIANAGGMMFRRLSNAFAAAPSAPPSRRSSICSSNALSTNDAAFQRNGSVSSTSSTPTYRMPNYLRASLSHGSPVSMPSSMRFEHHKLDTIPPTPAAVDDMIDPFDQNPFEQSVPPIVMT